MKCPKCKYKWETKSKLKYVTCPSCRLKILNIIQGKKEEKKNEKRKEKKI
jgi:DNA-directed RNA polymerase subunit RPC12/RpoP